MTNRMMTAGLLAWLCSSAAIAATGDDAKTPSALVGRRLQQDLVLQQTPDEVTYVSPWLKASFSLAKPAMTFLSVERRRQRPSPEQPAEVAPWGRTGGGPER